MNSTTESFSPGAAAGPAQRIAARAVLRKRFTIEQFLGRSPLGEIYFAVDGSDGKNVLVKLLAREFVRDGEVRSRLEQDAAIAAQLDHKNIAASYGFFVDGDSAFLAMEFVGGTTLRQMLEKKMEGGRGFTLKGAYNVVTHVCNGLEYAHGAQLHGVLNADTVLVNAAGRIKVGDFGLARSLPAQERFRALLGSANLACMAPELPIDPDHADRRVDIYSLGALLFELLSGKSYVQGARVSNAAPGMPPAIDAFIAKCVAPFPADRYSDVTELKRALHVACEGVLVAASAPPLPPGLPSGVNRTLTPPGLPRPNGAPSLAAANANRPPLPSPTPGSRSSGPLLAQARVPTTFSVDSALSAVDEAHERWLIQKDKLDLGPFKLADVKAQIEDGQIVGDHVIVDMENGERRKVREHTLLRDLVAKADARINAERIALQAAAAASAHRRRVLTIVAGVGAFVLVVAGGVAAYVLTHVKDGKTETKIVYRDRDIDDVLKGIEISMKVDPPPPKTAGHRRSGHGAGGTSGQKNANGEFDSATNLGDANSEGGDETLPREVVQKVMMSSFKSLTGCIVEEKHRDAALKNIEIDFVIKGSGQVSAVKVNGATNTPFASCMYGKMQSVPFPHFNGAKTVASFSLALK